jgi:hypothetical protein
MFAEAMSDRLNDRPKAPLPRSHAEWERMEGHLELFRQIAPIWVEQGKLLP